MVSLKKLSLAVLNLLSVVAGSDKVIVGYFSDWTLADYPTSAVPFELLTHVNYAFAVFDDKTWKPTIESPETLKDLVKKSKPTNTKVLISIGGWAGSKYFSPMAGDEKSRAAFIKNTVDFVKEYDIDGVDIDWEYPNRDGQEGNYKDPKDVENYKIVLKELKEALPKGILITAAVRVQPFDGPNGILKDVSAFADLFDFINIMAYDINGPWEPKTGPLSPFENEAGKGPQFSVKSSTSDWNNAGIPKEKLVVGVPFYGYQLGVDEDMSKGDNQYATVTKDSLPSYGFDGLMKNKILSSPTEANEGNGWVRKFDKVSKTPWLFNKESKTFISYDDPQSLKYKTDFVRCNGYKGAMIWALNNDYQSTLLKSLQNVHNSGSCDSNPEPSTPPTTTTTSPVATTSTTTTATSGATTSTTTTSPATTGYPVKTTTTTGEYPVKTTTTGYNVKTTTTASEYTTSTTQIPDNTTTTGYPVKTTTTTTTGDYPVKTTTTTPNGEYPVKTTTTTPNGEYPVKTTTTTTGKYPVETTTTTTPNGEYPVKTTTTGEYPVETTTTTPNGEYPVKTTTTTTPNGEYPVKTTETEAYPVKTTTTTTPNGEYPVKTTTTTPNGEYPVKTTTTTPNSEYPVKTTTTPNGEYPVKTTETEAYPVKTTTTTTPNGEYPVKTTETEAYPVKTTNVTTIPNGEYPVKTTGTEAYPVKTTAATPNGEYPIKPTVTEAYPVKATTEAYPVKATTTEAYPVKVITPGPYAYPVATTIIANIEHHNVVAEPTYVTKPTYPVKKCKSKQH